MLETKKTSLNIDVMKLRSFVFSFLYLSISTLQLLNAQESTKSEKSKRIKNDTITVKERAVSHKAILLMKPVVVPEIRMDEEGSIEYLQHIYSTSSMWKKRGEPLRGEMGVLLYNAIRPPFDSTTQFLTTYPYDSIKVPGKDYYVMDSIRIVVPVVSPVTLNSDSIPLPANTNEIYITAGKKTRKVRLSTDLLPLTKNDTLEINDSVYVLMRDFVPLALPRINHDTTLLVISDTLQNLSLQRDDFPFRRLKYPYMTDSIEVAIRTILEYLEDRDSSLIRIVSTNNRATNVWLNSNSDNLKRFWLPDRNGDSVTVWIGSPSRNTISLQTEEGVFFKRQTWHDKYADTKVNTISAEDETLRKVTLNKLRPDSWKYRGDISLLLSQASFTSWASGGNDNISTTLDINGYLYYTNKVTQLSWTTTGRLAIGMLKTEGVDIKKNLDIIDINSKVNHKAFGKFDFSGQMQFKTQSFPLRKNDTVLVSRFFNPATLIVGYGLDYKPTKTLSINFSPLSYRGIYVPDKKIDETLYGVDKGKRSKNEMGAYLTINSTNKLFKKISLTNKIQLFSSFLSKPQNIDVDWEMTMAANISWFADLKINTFLIYDDNTRINGVPKLQFKELLGVTFLFRF